MASPFVIVILNDECCHDIPSNTYIFILGAAAPRRGAAARCADVGATGVSRR